MLDSVFGSMEYAHMLINKSILLLSSTFLLVACSSSVQELPTSASSSSSSLSEVVQLESPTSDSLVTSPLTVKGKAINTWFFEASIPVGLLDDQGNEIVMQGVMTNEDWMSDGMHAFETQLSFVTSAKTGFVVIRKDNPSGDPERDAEVRIPVRFQ